MPDQTLFQEQGHYIARPENASRINQGKALWRLLWSWKPFNAILSRLTFDLCPGTKPVVFKGQAHVDVLE